VVVVADQTHYTGRQDPVAHPITSKKVSDSGRDVRLKPHLLIIAEIAYVIFQVNRRTGMIGVMIFSRNSRKVNGWMLLRASQISAIVFCMPDIWADS
jgi:hypothetical protein